MKMKKKLRCLIMPIIVLGVSVMAFGAFDYTGAMKWIGELDDDWNTVGTIAGRNWDTSELVGEPPFDPDAVPTSGTKVELGDPNYIGPFQETTIYIYSPADANDLIIGAGDPNDAYILNIDFSGSLTVGLDIKIGDDGTGTLNVISGGILTIGDDLDVGDSGDGTFTMVDGTLTVGDNVNVSRDDNGTGTMTLDNVIFIADDVYVASENDDESGTGVGTLTLIAPNATIDTDVRVGGYGTGTLVVTGGILNIGDDLEISCDAPSAIGTVTLTDVSVVVGDSLDIGADGDGGEGGTGELILNGTTTITGVGGDLKIGNGNTGDGTLTMNDNSSIISENNIDIGKKNSSVGTIEMNDNAYLAVDGDEIVLGDSGSATGNLIMNGPNTEIFMLSNHDLVVGEDGTGNIVMNGGTITIGDDLMIAEQSGSIGSITMNGGTIEVGDNVDIASAGDVDGKTADGSLHMNSGAQLILLNSGNDLDIGNNGTGVVTVTGSGTKITVTDDMDIADNDSCNGLLEIRDNALVEVNDNIFIGDDGGTGVIDVAGGTLVSLTGDLDLASQSDGGDEFGDATVIVGAGGVIDIDGDLNMAQQAPTSISAVTVDGGHILVGDDIRMGGTGGTATIELLDGRIDVNDELSLPDGATGATGGAVIILGNPDDTAIDPGDAKLEIDGKLLASDAVPGTDYIDFLPGGLLDLEYDKITAAEIEDLIESGVFTTSYAGATLFGVAPVTGGGSGVDESIQVVYDELTGNRFEIYLGIAVTPPVCLTPPAGDVDDDCIVGLTDFAIMAGQWMNDISLSL